MVADEAQHVKNARSSTAKALRTIGSGARVALTGTPVENDLTELWSILDWVIPGLLGSRQAFRRVWASPIEAGVHESKTRQFADLIGPFLLRRRKSDPGIAPELPAKTETDHPLGLTREQVVLYESFVRDTMARIERAHPDDQVLRRGLVLSLLTGLKQICNHPAQFLKQSGVVRLTGRSEKLELVDELLTTVIAEGGAALVFTQYVAMARLIAAHLERVGVPHQLLHGGTPIPERERMVARFQAGELPVFLLSLKAGGTGLNLTRADHVVHYDRWWNPAVEEQATDRAYRIGQTRPVQVHRLITTGTIEERVAQLLERKRSLAESVLGGGEAALTELDDDELRDLVTLRREDARATGGTGEPDGADGRPPPGAGPPRRRPRDPLVGQGVGARGRGGGVHGHRRPGRPAISRSGRIGQISVEPGRFVAAVEDEQGLWAVLGTVQQLDEQASEALVETIAAEAGRVAALLGGDLPHALVEHAEEAGVELLPYGGELGSTCTCDFWADPCPHALAVMYQLTWLLEIDPFVLLHLRGLPRDELLARLHERSGPASAPAVDAVDVDLDVAADAAAARGGAAGRPASPGVVRAQPVDEDPPRSCRRPPRGS